MEITLDDIAGIRERLHARYSISSDQIQAVKMFGAILDLAEESVRRKLEEGKE